MTARYLMMLALALGMGCSGDEGKPDPDAGTTDAPGDDDDDDDDDTVHTGGGGGGWDGLEAVNIFLESQFGYNSTTMSAVSIFDGGGYELPPDITIIFATDFWSFDLADTANYCAVVLPLSGSSFATPVAADNRLYWGAQYEIGNDPYLTNCNTPGYELDPYIWGKDPAGDFADLYGGTAWWTAVGDPTQAVTDVFAGYPDTQPLIIGGAIGVSPLLSYGKAGGQVDDVFGIAYEVDAKMNWVGDANGYLIPYDAVDVFQGGQPRQAWYSMTYLYGWTVSAN